MNEKITIDYKVYEGLVQDRETLRALEAGGVDNWEGFEFAMEEIQKRRALKDRLEDEINSLFGDLAEDIDAPAGWQAGYGICGDGAHRKVFSFLDAVEEIKKELGL